MTALGIAAGYDTSTTTFTSVVVPSATALVDSIHYLPDQLQPLDNISITGGSTATRRGKQVVSILFRRMSLVAYVYAVNNYEGKVTVKTQLRNNTTYTEYNATCLISNYTRTEYSAGAKWVYDVTFTFIIDGTASP